MNISYFDSWTLNKQWRLNELNAFCEVFKFEDEYIE